MAFRHAVPMTALALALAGCQGGGANAPSLPTGVGLPGSVTQSAAVSPSGGAVTATLGTSSVTVRAPSGALSGNGTLSVTLFAPGSSPTSLTSTARSIRTIGSGATLVVAFSVSLTGATLVRPLQASVATTAPSAGNVFRLAGFGTTPDDVDTVTFAAGTATTDQNIAFSRMSLADPTHGTLYAFYVEPSAQAAPAPTPVITVTTTAAQPIGMFGTATFTATEASPNGFPYLDPTFAFSLDNPTLGTIVPATGAFTAGPIDAGGHVVATDTTAGRGNPHGSGVVSVSSQRPGNVGDTFSFTGTLSTTTQLVNSNPTAPQTDSATVALTSSVGAFSIANGQNAVHSDETDAFALQTLKTGTDSVFKLAATSSSATLSILSSDAKDSNGVEVVNTFGAGNGVLDVIPENASGFAANGAALTLVETDPAGFGRTRTIASDGSFVENGHDSFGDVQTVTVNPDFSASYDARQFSGFRFTMTAPSAPPNPRIILRAFQGNTQIAAFNLASWIPATLTKPSVETDVTTTGVTFPAGCNVPAKYGTTGNRIAQTITRADTALGNLETLTTTTFVAPSKGVGPVCIQMSDNVQTFYDYTGQNGFVVLVSGGASPIQLASFLETLTLQSASTSNGTITQSTSRGTTAAQTASAGLSPGALAAVGVARSRFEHAVRVKLDWMRKNTFDRNFMSGGVQER